jgi:hypothetical protein
MDTDPVTGLQRDVLVLQSNRVRGRKELPTASGAARSSRPGMLGRYSMLACVM